MGGVDGVGGPLEGAELVGGAEDVGGLDGQELVGGLDGVCQSLDEDELSLDESSPDGVGGELEVGGVLGVGGPLLGQLLVGGELLVAGPLLLGEELPLSLGEDELLLLELLDSELDDEGSEELELDEEPELEEELDEELLLDEEELEDDELDELLLDELLLEEDELDELLSLSDELLSLELEEDGSDELLLFDDDDEDDELEMEELDELLEELELLELDELLSHGSQQSSRTHSPCSTCVALWTVTGRFISLFSARHCTSKSCIVLSLLLPLDESQQTGTVQGEPGSTLRSWPQTNDQRSVGNVIESPLRTGHGINTSSTAVSPWPGGHGPLLDGSLDEGSLLDDSLLEDGPLEDGSLLDDDSLEPLDELLSLDELLLDDSDEDELEEELLDEEELLLELEDEELDESQQPSPSCTTSHF